MCVLRYVWPVWSESRLSRPPLVSIYIYMADTHSYMNTHSHTHTNTSIAQCKISLGSANHHLTVAEQQRPPPQVGTGLSENTYTHRNAHSRTHNLHTTPFLSKVIASGRARTRTHTQDRELCVYVHMCVNVGMLTVVEWRTQSSSPLGFVLS